MKCSQCGKELPDSAKFCTNCGTPIEKEEIKPVPEQKEPAGPENTLGSDNKLTLKEKWNDKYTILAIIALMVVAAIGGLAVKALGSKDDKSNSDDRYVNKQEYEENEDDYYEESTDATEMEEQELLPNNILPESSSRLLTKADLAGLTAEQCRIARNEIYARHGRMFQDEALQAYFNSMDWYRPTIQPDDFEESLLNEYEVANRDLIVEFEEEQGYR